MIQMEALCAAPSGCCERYIEIIYLRAGFMDEPCPEISVSPWDRLYDPAKQKILNFVYISVIVSYFL